MPVRRCWHVLFLSMLLGCNSDPSPEEAARIEQQAAAERQQFEASQRLAADLRRRATEAVGQLQASLAAIKAALPAAASLSGDQSCPVRADLAGRLPVIEVADIDFVLAGAPAVEQRRAAASTDIRFISDFPLAELENWFALGGSDYASANPDPLEAIARSSIWVVFTPLARDLPSVSSTQATFQPTRIDGWLIAMDVAARHPLCRARVQSGNSPSVQSTMTVNLSTGAVVTPGPNLLLDAEAVFRAQARAAFARVAPAVTLFGSP